MTRALDVTRVAELTPQQRRMLVARLREHGVVVEPSAGGGLVACVRLTNEAEVTDAALHEHCKQLLPNYMVPQAFRRVHEFPGTATGKVDRDRVPFLEYESEEAAPAAREGPGNEVETALTQIWADALGFEDIGIHDNFFELGGDSLLSIRILSRAGKQGMSIKPEDFFDNPTIAAQAQLVSVANIAQQTGPATGSFPLTPIQRWFFENITTEQHHWNQSYLFSVDARLGSTELKWILEKLLLHHDILRSCYTQADGQWQGEVVARDAAAVPFTVVELAAEYDQDQDQDQDQDRAVMEATATRVNAELDLSVSPLLRFVLFRSGGEGDNRLLIVAHHLVVDAESWGILIEDCRSLCEQQIDNKPLQLSSRTTSFVHWAQRLTEYAGSDDARRVHRYWAEQRRIATTIATSPRDFDVPAAENTEGVCSTLSFSLDETSTGVLLREISRVFESQVNEALVSALGRVLVTWTGSSKVCFDMEGHGREALFDDLDLGRTLGWFTTVFPMVLDPQDGSTWDSPKAALEFAREKIRSMPHRGLGHGLSSLIHKNTAAGTSGTEMYRADILFNYLGKQDSMQSSGVLKLQRANFGIARSPACNRVYPIEINASIQGEQMCFHWTYCPRMHSPDTVEGLAQGLLNALQDLSAACARDFDAGPASRDFPLADLDQRELDQLSQFLEDLD